jgi:hypothetical protein
MKPLLKTLFALILALPLAALAQSDTSDAKKLLDDQRYCYGLASLAHVTVLRRNEGLTLEDQLQRRQRQLGEDSTEYKLMEDITRQIYNQDLRDPVPVLVSTHRSCLDGRGIAARFSDDAIRSCPMIGAMVSEVSALRRKGVGTDKIAEVLGERYGTLPKTYGGGLEKLAAKYNESSKPDSGAFDYSLCMVLGMNNPKPRTE